MRSPSDKFLPWNTVLDEKRKEILNQVIEGKRGQLKRCRYKDAELSLFLMEELEHLNKMKEFNDNLDKQPT